MLSVADQRRRRRCRNRRRCDIRHCSCELQLVKSLAREAEYHRRIRRTIARKLLYRQPHGTRARGRAWFVPKNVNYEFLRCISNVVGVSVIFLFFFSLFSLLFFSLFLSRMEEARCRAKKVGTSPRPTASEFRDYG